jgi:hypothetical protein
VRTVEPVGAGRVPAAPAPAGDTARGRTR